MTRRRWSVAWCGVSACLLGGLCWTTGRGQVPPPEATAHVWSPEVADVLAAYRSGDLAGAQRACADVLARPGDAARRRDAAVIAALCLLRAPARSDRMEGRARLAQLSRTDPVLVNEPECDLAYGIAQSALHETSAALEALERAAAGFAASGLTERQAEALEALAETWAEHGEWSTTPARFGALRPAGRAEANAVRRKELEALRLRLEALPNHAAALARLDLTLAKFLVADAGTAEEGYALLKRLAAAQPLDATGAAAAMRLAEHAEASQRWDEALELYERVRREAYGVTAEEAEQRSTALTQPQIVLTAPSTVRSGQSVLARLRVRGLDQVQFEARRVDVAAWLADSRARMSAARLPESGSVGAARELDTRAASAFAWWASDRVAPPLDFVAEPGAYVLLARGRARDGTLVSVKQLLVVSDLEALGFIGPRVALFWAELPADAEDHGSAVTGQFWMSRSFTATELTFADGVARFTLPGEARVMSEKGWVALLRSGPHLAVLRGQVPVVPAAEAAPRVMLLTAPPEPEAGEVLSLAGLLLPGSTGGTEGAAGAGLRLYVTDALENERQVIELPVAEGGGFTTQIRIPPEWQGQHLHFVVRAGGQILANVLARTAVSVPVDAAARFRVRIDGPSWLRQPRATVIGTVRAEYAWGACLPNALVQCDLHAWCLPAATGGAQTTLGVPAAREDWLSASGRMDFAVPYTEFGQADGPLAVNIEARVSTWDGRRGAGTAQVLLAPERPYVWLTQRPADAAVGGFVRFHIGWREPGGLVLGQRPDVEIRRAGAVLERLPLQTDWEGLTSTAWYPAEPGTYEVGATLPAEEAEPVRVSQPVEVAPAAAASRPAAAVHCVAQLVQTKSGANVQVRLDGESDVPLLAVLAGSDPGSARGLAELRGSAELSLPVAEETTRGLRVLVYGMDGTGYQELCAVDVAPDSRNRVEVKVTDVPTEVWPGTAARVRVVCGGAAGARPGTVLFARLVRAADFGDVDRPPGAESAVFTPRAALTLAASADAPGTAAKTVDPTTGDADAVEAETELLRLALWRGTTLWVTSMSVRTEVTELSVPVPAAPGVYRLIVVARTPDGSSATDETVLDAQRGVWLTPSVPPRLTLGDRVLIAVRVENGYREPIDARVRWEPGDGLHIDALRVLTDGQAPVEMKSGEIPSVKLRAGAQAWVQAEVEAVQAGAGRLTVVAVASGVESVGAATYTVLPADEPPTGASSIHIRRTVDLWTADTATANDSAEPNPPGGAQPRWAWRAVSASERLQPGQCVRVREDLTPSGPQGEVTWTQRLPATCQPLVKAPVKQVNVGTRQAGPPDALVYAVPGLLTGTQLHEYYLITARPGACALPAPEVRSGQTRVPVVVEPADVKFVVTNEP